MVTAAQQQSSVREAEPPFSHDHRHEPLPRRSSTHPYTPQSQSPSVVTSRCLGIGTEWPCYFSHNKKKKSDSEPSGRKHKSAPSPHLESPRPIAVCHCGLFAHDLRLISLSLSCQSHFKRLQSWGPVGWHRVGCVAIVLKAASHGSSSTINPSVYFIAY